MRKICLLAITTVITHLCFAQAQFGLKAGANLNHLNVSNGTGSDFKSKIGIVGGVTVDMKVSDHFYVQPELTYSSHILEEKDNNLTSKWKYSYFNIPLLLKYKFTGPVGIYVGPQLSFLSSASNKINGVEVGGEEDFTNIDFSGVAGIDYKLENGLRVDLRFQQSAFNLLKVEYADPLKTRQQVFSLTVGYVFKCDKKK